MPTVLATLLRADGEAALALRAGALAPGEAMPAALDDLLPELRSAVVIVVDGLGTANLKARLGHAPTLGSLPQRRITTVAPTTTSAALTTLTTGVLPGIHGMIGYQIRHPQLGLISPLRDWEGIAEPRAWQPVPTLFEHARTWGIRPVVIGRPAHAQSGLSEAILTGAEMLPGQRIADRFRNAREVLAASGRSLIYLYVDELDRAGHRDGWESASWTQRLEQLDEALHDFLTGLPADVGVVLTADHGMVDIAPGQRIQWEPDANFLQDVESVGGEPRFRSLYIRPGGDVERTRELALAAEGQRAWVVTRDEAMSAGWFGPIVQPGIAERLGEVLVVARKSVAYFEPDADPAALSMVGQHGALTDEERGIPVILGGALAGTPFARCLELSSVFRG